MKITRLALRLALATAACASIAACAGSQPQSTDMDYQSRPPSSAQGQSSNPGTPGSSGQRLTIQSGEGERLNLPWFIQDTKDWVNSN
ncbi:hypothetical protein ELS24_13400 [Achromobacter spanius]|jgi:type IV pilus biogenesis protein CpaD/CtpE|uniref:hypothetical protein n=1 Tax=Achromobacter spanius TaxID=217203 RepID=UPI000F8FB026|nr:hypothetical protein [Achromobacter spanius]AZS79362.1 hypothetical protein ELS24_13400 [Achromobacter spanius]